MSSTRATGIALAFVAALISGVAIFVNGHAVKHFGDATVYTTAKNAVAGLLLLALAWPLLSSRASGEARLPRARNQKLGVLAIAVVGGSVPFVLFFEGLARAEATQAAFIQKTLVVWVAILAVPLLRERLGILQLVAIAPARGRAGVARRVTQEPSSSAPERRSFSRQPCSGRSR